MKKQPLVSVITPAYNSQEFIAETITSVISQTYSNWELIIVDDNSKDNTENVVNAFIKREPNNIQYLKNSANKGAASARNSAIKIAKGDYIAFLDADDVWKPEKLETQVSFMLAQNTDVCYSSYDLMLENGELTHKTVKALPRLSYKKLLKCNYIGNLTGIYNARTLGKIYAPNLRKRQDWLLWLKAVEKSSTQVLGIEKSLAIYRLRKDSMSSNKLNLLKYNYKVYKQGLGFSTRMSIVAMLVFLYEYFFVKSKQTVSQ